MHCHPQNHCRQVPWQRCQHTKLLWTHHCHQDSWQHYQSTIMKTSLSPSLLTALSTHKIVINTSLSPSALTALPKHNYENIITKPLHSSANTQNCYKHITVTKPLASTANTQNCYEHITVTKPLDSTANAQLWTHHCHPASWKYEQIIMIKPLWQHCQYIHTHEYTTVTSVSTTARTTRCPVTSKHRFTKSFLQPLP